MCRARACGVALPAASRDPFAEQPWHEVRPESHMAFWGANHIFLQKKSYTQLATQTPLPRNLRTAVLGLLCARRRQTLMWVNPLPLPPHALSSSLRSSMTPGGQPLPGNRAGTHCLQ